MSESFLELTTAYRIEVWRARMKAGALFAPEDIENLIGLIAQDDAVLADFIQENMAIPRVRLSVDHAASLLYDGDIDGASQALDRINREYQYIDERIRKMRGIEMSQALVEASVAPFVEKERQSKEQKRKAGGADKKRKWAERLARQVNTWEEIPDSYAPPLEIDDCPVRKGEDRDVAIYRDGDDLTCTDRESGGQIGTLKRSTFERIYLRPVRAGKKRR